ncbi:hypothetical protein DFH09DRAFT_1344558 [Mycena vulgaris]|nr:hypothetical protein DFH09DRAFT_1344558 [Mycena vulgaris]
MSIRGGRACPPTSASQMRDISAEHDPSRSISPDNVPRAAAKTKTLQEAGAPYVYELKTSTFSSSACAFVSGDRQRVLLLAADVERPCALDPSGCDTQCFLQFLPQMLKTFPQSVSLAPEMRRCETCTMVGAECRSSTSASAYSSWGSEFGPAKGYEGGAGAPVPPSLAGCGAAVGARWADACAYGRACVAICDSVGRVWNWASREEADGHRATRLVTQRGFRTRGSLSELRLRRKYDVPKYRQHAVTRLYRRDTDAVSSPGLGRMLLPPLSAYDEWVWMRSAQRLRLRFLAVPSRSYIQSLVIVRYCRLNTASSFVYYIPPLRYYYLVLYLPLPLLLAAVLARPPVRGFDTFDTLDSAPKISVTSVI